MLSSWCCNKLMNTCSSLCFVCTHDGDDKSLPQIVWFIKLSFRCFECNGLHTVRNDIGIMTFSILLGDFVFPTFEDVSKSCLPNDLAFRLRSIHVCCANGAMIKLGHVINDVLLYHAHTLMCVGTNEWIATHNFMA